MIKKLRVVKSKITNKSLYSIVASFALFLSIIFPTNIFAETWANISGNGGGGSGVCTLLKEQVNQFQPVCLIPEHPRYIWIRDFFPKLVPTGFQNQTTTVEGCSATGPCWSCPSNTFFQKNDIGRPICIGTDVAEDKQLREGGCPDSNSSQGPIPKAGDPIIVANGNSFQTEVDYQSQNPFGLSFIRYYNSTAFDRVTGIGEKWRHNYDRRVSTNGVNTLVYRNNGQTFIFHYDGANWVGDADISDILVELVDGSNVRTGWSYTTVNDDVEYYNATGQLIHITNRQGQAKVFTYDVTSANGGDDNGATLDKITGFNSEVMIFSYDTSSSAHLNRIAGMTDPEGNIYSYSYDTAGNMQSVTYPDETPTDNNDNPTRTYHYENTAYPYHLTGLTDETGSRVTWAFDAQGRAISSELDGGVDKSTLVFNTDGSVTTTNPLGKDTTYHFTTLHGVKKVTQVEGHATASCVGANQNYTYDANGYMASKMDWQGKVTTYVHDARGLEVSRTEASGSPEARTITTDWHATFRLPIKVTEPGQVTDYTYDAQGRLLSQTTSDTP